MQTQSSIGHLNILEELGRGTFGTVYRAHDTSLNREVALKILHPQFAADPAFVNCFLDEARTTASINHPHVVRVYFCGVENGHAYMVMELVRGQTLEALLIEKGCLAEPIAITIALETMQGLEAAHRVGLVHADLKPSNIFLDEKNGVKIMDFGRTLHFHQNRKVQLSRTARWDTPYYIPPERVSGQDLDHRSDFYSLGATLYHTLTGRPPFEDKDLTRLMLKRLNEKPPHLKRLRPDVHNKTTELISKLLEPEVINRYRDHRQIMTDIRAAQVEIVSGPASEPASLPKAEYFVPERKISSNSSVIRRKKKQSLKKVLPHVLVISTLFSIAAFFFLTGNEHAKTQPADQKIASSDANPASAVVTPSIPENSFRPSIVVDNADMTSVDISGNWGKGVANDRGPFQGKNYLRADPSDTSPMSVRYIPDVPEDGKYDVYVWYTRHEKRCTRTAVHIAHAGGNSSVYIDQRNNGSQWNLVGTFSFNKGNEGYITISNRNADGIVIADAVGLTKVTN